MLCLQILKVSKIFKYNAQSYIRDMHVKHVKAQF